MTGLATVAGSGGALRAGAAGHERRLPIRHVPQAAAAAMSECQALRMLCSL
jgi:hypothetical protein